MIKHIDAREAHTRFAQLLGQVYDGKQAVIADRSGQPIVAIIPLEEYEQLVSEREARFQILDDIRRKQVFGAAVGACAEQLIGMEYDEGVGISGEVLASV